jgi:hypothetical protein
MGIRITSQGWAFGRWSFRTLCVSIATASLCWFLYDTGALSVAERFIGTGLPALHVSRRTVQIAGFVLPLILLSWMNGRLSSSVRSTARLVTLQRIEACIKFGLWSFGFWFLLRLFLWLGRGPAVDVPQVMDRPTPPVMYPVQRDLPEETVDLTNSRTPGLSRCVTVYSFKWTLIKNPPYGPKTWFYDEPIRVRRAGVPNSEHIFTEGVQRMASFSGEYSDADTLELRACEVPSAVYVSYGRPVWP